jgi:predicted dehydrogenase
MEGMWMKFNPAFRRLHEEIREGTIGEPRNVRAAFSVPFPEDGGSRWDINRSGSTLLDQGIYPVTLAHSVFGSPVAIHAAGTVRDDGIDIAQHFTLEYDGGRFAQCASGMTEFSDPSASVSGTHGWVSLPAPFWATTDLTIHAGASFESIFTPPPLPLPQEGNGYVPMLREVTDAIIDGKKRHPLWKYSRSLTRSVDSSTLRSHSIPTAA